MKLFIQLQVGDWKKSNYETPWLHFACSLSNDIMGTELDNQSVGQVADLVLKLIDQSDSVFLLILANSPDEPLGAGMNLIHYCLRAIDRVERVVLFGDHSLTEDSTMEFEEKFVKVGSEEEIKTQIREFAQ